MDFPRASLLAFVLSVLATGCFGGQTGDPGVAEFTSIDVDTDRSWQPGNGRSCAEGYVYTKDVGPGPARSLDGSLLLTLDASHVARFEARHGITVAELDGERGPERTALLRLPGAPVTALLRGQRLVVGVERHASTEQRDEQADAMQGSALVLVDVAEPNAPRVLREHELGGHIVNVHALERAGRTLLYVVSDDKVGSCVAPPKATAITSFELDGDLLVERDTLALGPQVQAVAVFDELVVVLDATGVDAGRMRIISLADVDGMLTLGDPVPVPGTWAYPIARMSAAVDLAGDVLRVVTAPELDGGGDAHVATYDASEPSAPRLVADCTVELMAPGGNGPLRATFASGQTFLATSPANDGSDGNDGANAPLPNEVFAVGLDQDGACITQALGTRNEASLFATLGGTRVLDLERAESGFRVRLLDGRDASAIAETTVTAPAELSGARYYPWDSAVFGATSKDAADGLLAVYYERDGELGVPYYGTQLLSFSATDVSARGRLSGAALATAGDGVLFGLLDGLLQTLDLSDLDAPNIESTLEIGPRFGRMWSFGEYLVRLRLPTRNESREGVPGGVSDQELLSPPESTLATLEVIPADGDPDLAQVLASVRVNPWAQFVRVGDLLVSLSNLQGAGPRPTRVEVIDLADPRAPEFVGSLETEALWLHDDGARREGPATECLGCAPTGEGGWALVLPNALVLRGETSHEVAADQQAHVSFTFHVLDLRDPSKPRLRDPIAMPAEDHALAALAHGSSLFYSYRVPEATMAGLPSARFYYREIDLSALAAPVVAEPINVPGEVVAVDEGRLYTHELAPGRDGPVTRLHVLSRERGRVALSATTSLGAFAAQAIELDRAGNVLVDLGDAFTVVDGELDFSFEPLMLRVFDADDLESLGGLDVAVSGRRIGTAPGRVFYDLPEGLAMVDVRDPSMPEHEAYFPRWSGGLSASGDIVAGERPVVLVGDVPMRLDLDSTP